MFHFRNYSTGDLDRKTQDPPISAQKQWLFLHEKIKKVSFTTGPSIKGIPNWVKKTLAITESLSMLQVVV